MATLAQSDGQEYPSIVSPVMTNRGKYKNSAHQSERSPSLAPHLKWFMSQYPILAPEAQRNLLFLLTVVAVRFCTEG